MTIVKILVLHFINSKKYTKYQLIVAKFLDKLLQNVFYLTSTRL